MEVQPRVVKSRQAEHTKMKADRKREEAERRKKEEAEHLAVVRELAERQRKLYEKQEKRQRLYKEVMSRSGIPQVRSTEVLWIPADANPLVAASAAAAGQPGGN